MRNIRIPKLRNERTILCNTLGPLFLRTMGLRFAAVFLCALAVMPLVLESATTTTSGMAAMETDAATVGNKVRLVNPTGWRACRRDAQRGRVKDEIRRGALCNFVESSLMQPRDALSCTVHQPAAPVCGKTLQIIIRSRISPSPPQTFLRTQK